jgi:acetyltransferase-like isoleucine patch superfamily enzyme
MNLANIEAEEICIGKHVTIHPSAVIKGFKGIAKRIVIGDNTFIGNDVQILCDNFTIGDYGKIHNHTTIHGPLACSIGHNAWIGQYSILDTTGELVIGNNCGIGAHSQLWSHIKYGDSLEGNKFNKVKKMEIGNDVWFVGHCIVSPIIAQDKSMALAGSVISKDMAFNQLYGGCPAKNLTHKLGNPFADNSLESKLSMMQEYLEQSNIDTSTIKIITDIKEIKDESITYFNVANRTYTKRLSEAEIKLMHYLLPEKAKFVPFINSQ